eukprot:254388-Chlamydomonas_euryale.AAC.1
MSFRAFSWRRRCWTSKPVQIPPFPSPPPRPRTRQLCAPGLSAGGGSSGAGCTCQATCPSFLPADARHVRAGGSARARRSGRAGARRRARRPCAHSAGERAAKAWRRGAVNIPSAGRKGHVCVAGVDMTRIVWELSELHVSVWGVLHPPTPA